MKLKGTESVRTVHLLSFAEEMLFTASKLEYHFQTLPSFNL